MPVREGQAKLWFENKADAVLVLMVNIILTMYVLQLIGGI